jgi:hypothetical protein
MSHIEAPGHDEQENGYRRAIRICEGSEHSDFVARAEQQRNIPKLYLSEAGKNYVSVMLEKALPAGQEQLANFIKEHDGIIRTALFLNVALRFFAGGQIHNTISNIGEKTEATRRCKRLRLNLRYDAYLGKKRLGFNPGLRLLVFRRFFGTDV